LNKFFIFLILNFLSFNIYAETIATIKLSYLIENSIQYISFLKKLESEKNVFHNALRKEEKFLEDRKIKIEDSKILFNEEELKNQIAIYNEDIKLYQEKINKYNNFLNDNMEINQKKLIDEIFLIVKDISIENNFDLVFNEDQYFISNENIDISELVLEKLNHQQFDLDIIHYK